MIETDDPFASRRRSNWVQRLTVKLMGPALPASLQAELTRDLGNYYLSFALAGPVAALICVGVAVAAKSLPALFFAGLALAGFAFIILACRAVRLGTDGVDLEELEARFALGTVIISVGMGGIIVAVLAHDVPILAEFMLVMVALATLGASNGTGPGRPLLSVVQFMTISLPLGISLALYWPMPWGVGAGLSLVGTAVASDAFFPFRDGLDVVVDAGATSVIQPGGSMRDAEVIGAADERGVVMALSGVRHFRH